MVILLHLHQQSRIQSLSAIRTKIQAVWATLLRLTGTACMICVVTGAHHVSASDSASIVAEHLDAQQDHKTSIKTYLQQCLATLDATVALATNENNSPDYLLERFAEAEQDCADLPQLAHNQGVVAGRADRWPEAIDHFERSLQLDGRAAMTHRHLQQIFEHRAAAAYALALNIPTKASPPKLQLQRSTDQNAASSVAFEHSELHNIGTLEYELFAWWQALHNTIGLKEHYVDDFPTSAIRRSRQKFELMEWANMHREIAFTAKDAVVVISDTYHNRTLLLLRLVGNRWKIYQETTL